MFGPEPRQVAHEYSDADEFGEVTWACYALDEVMAEKLRAVLGQRRFAIARDPYDIHRLLAIGVNESRIRAALPAKLEAKALEHADLSVERILSRLVQPDALPAFEEVWQETAAFLQTVLRPQLPAE